MPIRGFQQSKKQQQILLRLNNNINNKTIISKKNFLMFILMFVVIITSLQIKDVYLQEVQQLSKANSQGKLCLNQYKKSSCTPFSQSQQCLKLMTCLQQSDDQLNNMDIGLEALNRICGKLSQKYLGPMILAIITFFGLKITSEKDIKN